MSNSDRKQMEAPLMGDAKQRLKLVRPELLINPKTAIIVCLKHSNVNYSYSDYADQTGYATSGGFSKFINTVAMKTMKALVMFMKMNGNLAPLQWMAKELGVKVTLAKTQAELIQEQIDALEDKKVKLEEAA